jgi:segregation and condensation protein B
MSRNKKADFGGLVDVKELAERAGAAFREMEEEAAPAISPELNLTFSEDQPGLESPEAETSESLESEASDVELSGTELEGFEAANIEDLEILTSEQVCSIVESVLFATDKPLSIALIKQPFKGTNVKSKDIREALNVLMEEYKASNRGFTLEQISGGFQLRTKAENAKYLRQGVKARPFKLSGPALEVLSICAYKQPVTKAQIDEIRGVESGHLLRALMEKHLVTFGERSDLPGKPMFYETTRKFLEIFGLRNLQELPSLAEIDQLIPEGIGEIEEKETLSDLTGQLSQEAASSYSVGEEELLKITDELSQITTSSEFFEEEKRRMRDRRDQERAQNLREAMAVGESIDDKDRRWLERFEAGLVEQAHAEKEAEFVAAATVEAGGSPDESTGQ